MKVPSDHKRKPPVRRSATTSQTIETPTTITVRDDLHPLDDEELLRSTRSAFAALKKSQQIARMSRTVVDMHASELILRGISAANLAQTLGVTRQAVTRRYAVQLADRTARFAYIEMAEEEAADALEEEL